MLANTWFGNAEIDEKTEDYISLYETQLAQADSLMDDISNFIEENTNAEILDEEREIR